MVVIEDARDGFKMLFTSILSSAHGDPLRVVYPENWSWYASAKEAPVGGEHIVHLPLRGVAMKINDL